MGLKEIIYSRKNRNVASEQVSNPVEISEQHKKLQLFYDILRLYNSAFTSNFKENNSFLSRFLLRSFDRRPISMKLNETSTVAVMYMQMVRAVAKNPNDFKVDFIDELLEISSISSELMIDWHDLAMRQEADLYVKSKSITLFIDFLRDWKKREKVNGIEKKILHKHLLTVSRYVVNELYDSDNARILREALAEQPLRVFQGLEFYGNSNYEDQNIKDRNIKLEKAIAEILKRPFDLDLRQKIYLSYEKCQNIVSYQGPTLIEEDFLTLHPLKLLKILHRYLDQIEMISLDGGDPKIADLHEFRLLIGTYSEVVEDHEILASTLNRVSSGWRTYAGLNLNSIKNAVYRFLYPPDDKNSRADKKYKNVRKKFNAISFDETRRISCADLKRIIKRKNPNLSENLDQSTSADLLEIIEESVNDVFRYEYNEWKVDKKNENSVINKFLVENEVESLFCRYNRGAIRSKEARILLPLNGLIVFREDNELKFSVAKSKLRNINNENLKTLYELIRARRTGEAKSLCHSLLPAISKREVRELIAELGTLPVLIIKKRGRDFDKYDSTEQQNITTREVNNFRDSFPTANMIMVANLFDRNLVLSMNTNHDSWDGAHSQKMLDILSRSISQAIIDKPSLVGLTPDTFEKVDREGNEVIIFEENASVPPQVGIFPSKNEIADLEPFSALQISVESKGFFDTANTVAGIARVLKKSGKISTESKLTSPAFIAQLMLLQKYSEIAISQSVIKNYDALGILLGGEAVDNDLDLIRVIHGFDAKNFLLADKVKQEQVLKLLDQQIGSAHSNINRYIVPFIELLATVFHLPMNQISMTFDEVISSLQGKIMISGFGFERFGEDGRLSVIKNDDSDEVVAKKVQDFRDSQAMNGVASAGPALTPSQKIALTICHAHYVINDQGYLQNVFLSLRVKHENNFQGYDLAQELMAHIESFNSK